jgi:hypothetical protein
MSIGFVRPCDDIDNNHTADKSTRVDQWEIHSWGNGRLPGMAALSAIATLQLGATLAESPADKIAMSKAAEYLTNALALQLRIFRQVLTSD